MSAIDQAEDALTFLKAIYRNSEMPLPVRMRATIEALPYENPKLSAVAVASMSEQDFAARLERCIARSMGPKLIEAQPVPEHSNGNGNAG
jgi:hypothetical protein